MQIMKRRTRRSANGNFVCQLLNGLNPTTTSAFKYLCGNVLPDLPTCCHGHLHVEHNKRLYSGLPGSLHCPWAWFTEYQTREAVKRQRAIDKDPVSSFAKYLGRCHTWCHMALDPNIVHFLVIYWPPAAVGRVLTRAVSLCRGSLWIKPK